MASQVLVLALLALASSCSLHVLASDPSPLQDFCVADTMSHVLVNGFVCKNPMYVNDQDFTFSGLDRSGNTNNPLGSNVTLVTVNQLPGVNTLSISMVRIDYGPYGLIPPHYHPRATKILAILEGTLGVGFVTSNPPNGPNRLISRILKKGDVFVFPIGLIHFQINLGETKAVAIAVLSSQNPGVITIANAVFGSKPPISPDVLIKAFQLDKKVVDYLQKQF